MSLAFVMEKCYLCRKLSFVTYPSFAAVYSTNSCKTRIVEMFNNSEVRYLLTFSEIFTCLLLKSLDVFLFRSSDEVEDLVLAEGVRHVAAFE